MLRKKNIGYNKLKDLSEVVSGLSIDMEDVFVTGAIPANSATGMDYNGIENPQDATTIVRDAFEYEIAKGTLENTLSSKTED